MGLKPEPISCRVAIIGAGNMAREHARAFRDVPGVTLAGIHSRTRLRAENLAREFGIAGVYDDIEEMHQQSRADLVVVSVSEVTANAVSRACFEFPWAVLIEKPPGYNLSDSEDIHQAAAAKKRRVFVALNRRFNSSTRIVLSELAEFAGPRFISVNDQQDIEEAAWDDVDPRVQMNLMYANSIHVIDYLSLFGRGEITSVTPVRRWNARAPQTVVAHIEFSSGDAGLYTGLWNGPGPWSVAVNTPGRRWEMRPLEQLAFQNRGERRVQPVETARWDMDFKPGFRLQAEMAVRAAMGQESDSPTLAEALRTMRLIHSIYEQ